jgi:hypothetical protein
MLCSPGGDELLLKILHDVAQEHCVEQAYTIHVSCCDTVCGNCMKCVAFAQLVSNCTWSA